MSSEDKRVSQVDVQVHLVGVLMETLFFWKLLTQETTMFFVVFPLLY